MSNYTPKTQIKLEIMARIINDHPEYGSTRLGTAIFEKAGSRLNKQVLLRESKAYRESQGIISPREVYPEYRKLENNLKTGQYIDSEKQVIYKQVSRYTPDGFKNFVNSQVLTDAVKGHSEWFNGLLKMAENTPEPKQAVTESINRLLNSSGYDPFAFLREVYRPRPVHRDYDQRRRAEAIRKRDEAQERIRQGLRRR